MLKVLIRLVATGQGNVENNPDNAQGSKSIRFFC